MIDECRFRSSNYHEAQRLVSRNKKALEFVSEICQEVFSEFPELRTGKKSVQSSLTAKEIKSTRISSI